MYKNIFKKLNVLYIKIYVPPVLVVLVKSRGIKIIFGCHQHTWVQSGKKNKAIFKISKVFDFYIIFTILEA